MNAQLGVHGGCCDERRARDCRVIALGTGRSGGAAVGLGTGHCGAAAAVTAAASATANSGGDGGA